MRRHELWANLILLSPMIFGLGMLLVVIWPINYIVMGALYAIGLVDLVYAKLPLFRHGVLTTFGPSHIPRKRRLAYFRGYTRIALGTAFNLLVVLYYLVATS
ncbi:hypothetical protein [Aureliella helgolandensis]|nr:hypothetical protein [Aureliella helgolandensis]